MLSDVSNCLSYLCMLCVNPFLSTSQQSSFTSFLDVFLHFQSVAGRAPTFWQHCTSHSAGSIDCQTNRSTWQRQHFVSQMKNCRKDLEKTTFAQFDAASPTIVRGLGPRFWRTFRSGFINGVLQPRQPTALSFKNHDPVLLFHNWKLITERVGEISMQTVESCICGLPPQASMARSSITSPPSLTSEQNPATVRQSAVELFASTHF